MAGNANLMRVSLQLQLQSVNDNQPAEKDINVRPRSMVVLVLDTTRKTSDWLTYNISRVVCMCSSNNCILYKYCSFQL